MKSDTNYFSFLWTKAIILFMPRSDFLNQTINSTYYKSDVIKAKHNVKYPGTALI